MSYETRGDWMLTDPYDMRGRKFEVGDKAVRAIVSGRASNIEICEVTLIKDGNIYLDGSKRAINYPGRLLIVTEIFK